MAFVRIPTEIITSIILYHLPAKSVARFRCVSKGWLFLLSQPEFIKKHQKTLNQNHLLFLSKYYTPYSLPFIHHGEISRPTELLFKSHDPDLFTFHGSCNGLVFASVWDSYNVHVFVIFNPTTRDLVELPKPGNESRNVYNVHKLYGFGYDSVTDDYKSVAISFEDYNCLFRRYHRDDKMTLVNVYSLKSNTWRQVTDLPYGHGKCLSLFGVFVNGFLHWIVKNRSNKSLVIVAFSLADEKFSEVPLPKFCNDVGIMMSNTDCKLVDLGEKLAIFFQTEGEIWLMNEYGVNEYWTKIVVHGFNEIPMVRPMLFYDNGKLVFVTCDLMITYDLQERAFCKSSAIVSNVKLFMVISAYVESLVSPNLAQTVSKSREE
ncbi:F-box associated domain containing protein [Tanacetum coccineum]